MAQPNLSHNSGHASGLPPSEATHAEGVRRSKLGATPGRLVVVFVLAIILAVVLYVQFGATEAPVELAVNEHRAPLTVHAPQPAGAKSATSSGKANGDRQESKSRPWPTFSVEQVRRHNPFRLPATLAADVEPAGTGNDGVGTVESAEPGEDDLRDLLFQQQRGEAFANLRDEGIRVVVLGPHQRVVMIGTRDLRVGDVVDGFKVSEIGPGGVVLEDTERRFRGEMETEQTQEEEGLDQAP